MKMVSNRFNSFHANLSIKSFLSIYNDDSIESYIRQSFFFFFWYSSQVGWDLGQMRAPTLSIRERTFGERWDPINWASPLLGCQTLIKMELLIN